eukprot:m51a1_g4570 hypothetical protein (70) ;mRNA; r:138784-139105
MQNCVNPFDRCTIDWAECPLEPTGIRVLAKKTAEPAPAKATVAVPRPPSRNRSDSVTPPQEQVDFPWCT